MSLAAKECALFGCGKRFEPGPRANSRSCYCSRRCRQKAYRLRGMIVTHPTPALAVTPMIVTPAPLPAMIVTPPSAPTQATAMPFLSAADAIGAAALIASIPEDLSIPTFMMRRAA
jgi:hypothetical protein